MRNQRNPHSTRQVIHIVGEGLTELFYFSHIKKLMGYHCSISPRLFENNSIEKIEKKIKELLKEDVFVICVFDADVSRRSDAENKKLAALKHRYEKNKNILLCDGKMETACRLAERYDGKDSYSTIYKAIEKLKDRYC